jgi:hypothetical protein
VWCFAWFRVELCMMRDFASCEPQFDVDLFDADELCGAEDGLFSPSTAPRQSAIVRPANRGRFLKKLQTMCGRGSSPQSVGAGGLGASCGSVKVAVKVIVDLYMMNNAAIRVQAAVRARQQRRKYMQAKAARALAASSLSAAIARGGVDSAEAENAAAIMMQCAWRSRQARRKVIEYRQAKLMAEV